MSLIEALKILSIHDLNTLTKEELKKIYRKLLKKYHPDNNNGDDTKAKDITKANEVVLAALVEIESYKEMMKVMQRQYSYITSVLPLSTLIDIYKGSSISFNVNGDTVVIDKTNLLRHNFFIMVDFSIAVLNESTKYFNRICKLDFSRSYEIICDIEVVELKALGIEINILNEKRNFTMEADGLRVPIRLDEDIRIILNIRKKLKTTNGETGDTGE